LRQRVEVQHVIAREQIRQRARDDMLDFDSLTQWEREQATRLLFVWPYLRAATKWPFIYAKERPVVTGLAAAAAERAPEVATDLPFTSAQGSSEVQLPELNVPDLIPGRPDTSFSLGGRTDLAQLNPLSVAAEMSGTTQSVAHGDLGAAFDYLTPGIGFAAGLKDTRSVSDAAWLALANFVPYGQMVRTTGDRGLGDALADEALRFTPRRPFRSIRKSKAEEEAAIEGAYGEVLDNPILRRSFDAYWSHRDTSSRLRLATRERYGREKLSVEEEYELLKRTWNEYFSDVGEFPRLAPSEPTNKAIAEAMFGAREYIAHGIPGEEG